MLPLLQGPPTFILCVQYGGLFRMAPIRPLRNETMVLGAGVRSLPGLLVLHFP